MLSVILCRAPGGKPRQLCPGSADVDFVSYFNGSISLRSSTPWPLLRVSHDYFWVLRDAFLWNERDPHAPAGIVSEELSELGQGQLFVVDVNGDLAVRAAVVGNAAQHLAARTHWSQSMRCSICGLPGGISVTVLSRSSSSRCCAAIISLSVTVFICGPGAIDKQNG